MTGGSGNESPSLTQADSMEEVIIRIGFSRMEDPAPEHLWFDAIGSIAIVAALAVVFIVGVLKAEKVPSPHPDDSAPLAMSTK